MAIRVLIERQTIPGNEMKLNKLLMQLRGLAVQARGYISGETLHTLEDPNHTLVISTWETLWDWKTWEGNEERQKIQAEVDKLLRAPSTHRVYVHATQGS